MQVIGSLNLNSNLREWKVQSCSAVNSEGVQNFKDGLEWLTQTIDSKSDQKGE
jgi:hypothetical protein